jgi:formamidopyrimidine-DNA glycosylase
MPELPEVEVIAQTLQAQVVGQQIDRVEIRWEGSIDRPAPEEFARQLEGSTIVRVGRRAKFLVLQVQPARYLLVHLRMSGQLIVCDESSPGGQSLYHHRHTRVVIHFASGKRLCFVDQRKFGRMYLVDDPGEKVGKLGPEPLADDFTPDKLAEILRRHHRQIKPLLLDQEALAGLGNIYVDESLWEARIHPTTRADTLSDEQVHALYQAIRRVLTRALCNRGTTFRDYRDSNGESGGNLAFLNVYHREDKPCLRCGHAIARIKVAQRSSFFCPVCQPAPVAPDEQAKEHRDER